MAFATITCIWRECKPDVPSPRLTAPGYEAHWQYQSVIVPQVWVGPLIHTQSLRKNFGVKCNLTSRDQIKHDTIWRLLCELPAATGHVPVFSISVLMSPPPSPWPLVTPLSLKSPVPVVMHLCCNPLSLADFDVHVHTQRFTICSKTVLQTQNTFESGLQSAALVYFYRC